MLAFNLPRACVRKCRLLEGTLGTAWLAQLHRRYLVGEVECRELCKLVRQVYGVLKNAMVLTALDAGRSLGIGTLRNSQGYLFAIDDNLLARLL